MTSTLARWLPFSSRILSASTTISNDSGSARRVAMMSMSMAVQPPIAISSNSVGVNSSSAPVPKTIRPPRELTAANCPAAMRSTVSVRCVVF